MKCGRTRRERLPRNLQLTLRQTRERLKSYSCSRTDLWQRIQRPQSVSLEAAFAIQLRSTSRCFYTISQQQTSWQLISFTKMHSLLTVQRRWTSFSTSRLIRLAIVEMLEKCQVICFTEFRKALYPTQNCSDCIRKDCWQGSKVHWKHLSKHRKPRATRIRR